MKHNRNILFILVLVFIFVFVACGPAANDMVNDDNVEKTDEPMAAVTPNDNDSDDSPADSDMVVNEDEDEDNEDAEDTMKEDTDATTESERLFTLEELSKYNGQNGMAAYVAVNGVVYDFTNLGAWRNGKHNGFTAGKDLTEEIINVSPHGVKNLEGVPVVGKLADE